MSAGAVTIASIGVLLMRFRKKAMLQLRPPSLRNVASATELVDAVVGIDAARGTHKGAAYTVFYRYTVTYIRPTGDG